MVLRLLNETNAILTVYAPSHFVVGGKAKVKDSMGIPILLFPPSLLGDILSAVPVTAKTYLDPYLRRKFVGRYGEAIVKRFDNMREIDFTEEKKSFKEGLKDMLMVYFICLILLTTCIYLKNPALQFSNSFVGPLLLASFCLSLVYYILRRFLGDER